MNDRLDWKFLEALAVVTVRQMRKRNWLSAADRTDLRLALDSSRGEAARKIARMLDETYLELEARKDTPKKRDD